MGRFVTSMLIWRPIWRLMVLGFFLGQQEQYLLMLRNVRLAGQQSAIMRKILLVDELFHRHYPSSRPNRSCALKDGCLFAFDRRANRANRLLQSGPFAELIDEA